MLRTVLFVYSGISAALPIFIGAYTFFIERRFSDGSNSLSSIVASLVLATVIVTQTLNILQAFLNRQEQLEMVSLFTSIDVLLERQLLTRIDYKKIKNKFYVKFGVALMILLFVQIIFIVLVVNSRGNYFWLYHAFPALSLRIRCFQNMFYVDMVTEMLRILNARLENLIDNRESKLNLILFVDRLRERKNLNEENPLYEEILLLKQIYGKVWDICNLINDSFGWSLLAITTQYFIEFTSSGYYLFLALENFLPRIVAYECCCALVPLVIVLSLLAYSCFCCTQNVSCHNSDPNNISFIVYLFA